MLLYFSATGATIDTAEYTITRGFATGNLTLDETAGHTIVWKAIRPGKADVVWKFATEGYADAAFAGITGGIDAEDPTGSVDAVGAYQAGIAS